MTNTPEMHPEFPAPFFRSSVVPIPGTMEETCSNAWISLGAPGTWLTAEERVAVIREVRQVRSCKLCAQRKEAVSPYGVEGIHQDSAPLRGLEVDAIHRIATDPGRLGARWHRELLEGGVTDARLVEIIGVIATVFCIESIAVGTGARELPLPEPQEGEPTRLLPEGATTETARVPTVRPDKATGELAEYYRALGGMSANIRTALTLVPAEAWTFARLHDAVYVPGDQRFLDMNYGSALSRPQMELIAASVSSANECFY